MGQSPEIITPEDLLQIYALGCFPMAESMEDDTFSIVEPKIRACLPIHDLHIPKRLRRKVRQRPFNIRIDTDFPSVIRQCALARPETWINRDIEQLFIELHSRGIAHSIECWHGEKLVGGLYGLALGRVFCGESMFSLETDASKVALVHLCARLDAAGFALLDAQFHNPHLEQFGLYQIPQAEYCDLLSIHKDNPTDFMCTGKSEAQLIMEFLGHKED